MLLYLIYSPGKLPETDSYLSVRDYNTLRIFHSCMSGKIKDKQRLIKISTETNKDFRQAHNIIYLTESLLQYRLSQIT